MKQLIHLFLVLLSYNLLAQQPTPAQIKQVKDAKKEVRKMKGAVFHDFSLVTLSGDTLTNADANGNVLLVNFWFSGCRPCLDEIPHLNELVETFKDEPVLFIAPTFDPAQKVQRFITKFPFDYHLVPDVKDFCLELNIRSYPTHFVVDQDGVIQNVIIGYGIGTMASLEKSVRKLLKSE